MSSHLPQISTLPLCPSGTYILGQTRTGKSTVQAKLILAAMESGSSVVVLDPHRSLVSDVAANLPTSRESSVLLADVADHSRPFGLNLFECDNPKDQIAVSRQVDSLMGVFERVWEVSSQTPRLAQYLRNSAYVLIANRLTLLDLPRLLTNKLERSRWLYRVDNQAVREFWRMHDSLPQREQMIRIESTYDRVDAFVSNRLVAGIVGQPHSTIDVPSLLRQGKSLLVQLDPALPELTGLIGSLLIGRVLEAALKRSGPCHLFVDEYQWFPTDDMLVILAEGQKFGLVPHLAHQYRQQLPRNHQQAVLNAGAKVFFRLMPQDAQELVGVFRAPTIPGEPQKVVKTISHYDGSATQESQSAEAAVKRVLDELNWPVGVKKTPHEDAIEWMTHCVKQYGSPLPPEWSAKFQEIDQLVKTAMNWSLEETLNKMGKTYFGRTPQREEAVRYVRRYDWRGQPDEVAEYEWKPGPPLPISQVQDQLANQLATLDAFHAWCKLPSQEAELYVTPLGHGDAGRESSLRYRSGLVLGRDMYLRTPTYVREIAPVVFYDEGNDEQGLGAFPPELRAAVERHMRRDGGAKVPPKRS